MANGVCSSGSARSSVLPQFAVPLAKWKINNSLLVVQVIIDWICHQLAHPCTETGKA